MYDLLRVIVEGHIPPVCSRCNKIMLKSEPRGGNTGGGAVSTSSFEKSPCVTAREERTTNCGDAFFSCLISLVFITSDQVKGKRAGFLIVLRGTFLFTELVTQDMNLVFGALGDITTQTRTFHEKLLTVRLPLP